MFSFSVPQVQYGLVAIIAHANIIFLANNKYFAGMVVVAISTEVSVFSVAVFCPGEGCQCIFFINHSLHLPQFCELSPPPPISGQFFAIFQHKKLMCKKHKRQLCGSGSHHYDLEICFFVEVFYDCFFKFKVLNVIFTF